MLTQKRFPRSIVFLISTMALVAYSQNGATLCNFDAKVILDASL